MTREEFRERILKIIENIRNSRGMLNDMLEPELMMCDSQKGTSVMRYRRFKWEENGRGEVHGGVISAMLDTSMGVTAVAFINHDVYTADMSVSFIRPFDGRSFLIESEVIHCGRRLIRLSARAVDEETGKLLATGTSSFMPAPDENKRGILRG